MSSIIGKFNKYIPATVIVSVVLISAGILSSSASDKYVKSGLFSENTVIGGPETRFFESQELALVSSASFDGFNAVSDESNLEVFRSEEAALMDAGRNPAGFESNRDGLLVYKIKSGETLSKIASDFGISLNTILWANPKLRVNLVQPGEEIAILPVDGILHDVKAGETVSFIAGLYAVPVDKIMRVNPKIGAVLPIGERVVIPGAKPRPALVSASRNLPSIPGYFGLPTSGKNWGQLHANNAVDIANECGTPIFSAQEGLVIDIGNPENWNGGFGGYLEIEHPNQTGTLYAHLQKLFVAEGDYVSKGQLIAEMGNTGKVKGSPGCHVHFGVIRAKNPLAK